MKAPANYSSNTIGKGTKHNASTIGSVWVGIYENIENKYKQLIYFNRTVTTQVQVNIYSNTVVFYNKMVSGSDKCILSKIYLLLMSYSPEKAKMSKVYIII